MRVAGAADEAASAAACRQGGEHQYVQLQLVVRIAVRSMHVEEAKKCMNLHPACRLCSCALCWSEQRQAGHVHMQYCHAPISEHVWPELV
jgi:hypothetical protein